MNKTTYFQYIFGSKGNIVLLAFMAVFTTIFIWINTREGSFLEILPFSWPVWCAWILFFIGTYVRWKRRHK